MLKDSATLTPSLSCFYSVVSVLIMAGLRSLASVHTDTSVNSVVKTDVAASWEIFNSGDWGRSQGSVPGSRVERGKVREMGCRSLNLFALARFPAIYPEETKVGIYIYIYSCPT